MRISTYISALRECDYLADHFFDRAVNGTILSDLDFDRIYGMHKNYRKKADRFAAKIEDMYNKAKRR